MSYCNVSLRVGSCLCTCTKGSFPHGGIYVIWTFFRSLFAICFSVLSTVSRSCSVLRAGFRGDLWNLYQKRNGQSTLREMASCASLSRSPTQAALTPAPWSQDTKYDSRQFILPKPREQLVIYKCDHIKGPQKSLIATIMLSTLSTPYSSIHNAQSHIIQLIPTQPSQHVSLVPQTRIHPRPRVLCICSSSPQPNPYTN